MKNNYHEFLVFSVLIAITLAAPNILLLNLTSNSSMALLSPLFNQNLNLQNAINNLNSNQTLDLNTQFVPLFNFITSNSKIFSQLIQNLSLIPGLQWTQAMTLESSRNFLISFMSGSLSVFYHFWTDTVYLLNEEQCQQLLNVVIATGWQDAINNILSPITGSYFWNKRCILSQTNLVSIADQKTNNLDYSQKLALVSVITRMRVVHSLIFGLSWNGWLVSN